MSKENQKIKQNLFQKIRESKAAFVPTDEPQTKRFKYFSNVFGNIKRSANTLIQKPKLWASNVDWEKVRNDLASFIVESFLEGATANFATHYLFEIPLSIPTIFAHGIIIKQGLDIYWRLRNYGPNSKIPQKNK